MLLGIPLTPKLINYTTAFFAGRSTAAAIKLNDLAAIQEYAFRSKMPILNYLYSNNRQLNKKYFGVNMNQDMDINSRTVTTYLSGFPYMIPGIYIHSSDAISNPKKPLRFEEN